MTAPDLPVGDIEPSLKAWAISIVGDTAHVAYAVPDKWNWAKPVVTVRVVIESYAGMDPNSDVLVQLDCWAGPRDKATAATLKALFITALYQLAQYIDTDNGVILAAAYGTTATWAPDDTTTTGSTRAGPLPRYSISTNMVAGKAPVMA